MKTLAQSDSKAKHLFVVANAAPTDDADVHPAASRGLVPQLQELGTMPPPLRWAYLRQKLIQVGSMVHPCLSTVALACHFAAICRI